MARVELLELSKDRAKFKVTVETKRGYDYFVITQVVKSTPTVNRFGVYGIPGRVDEILGRKIVVLANKAIINNNNRDFVMSGDMTISKFRKIWDRFFNHMWVSVKAHGRSRQFGKVLFPVRAYKRFIPSVIV